jgi:hypothetical protein
VLLCRLSWPQWFVHSFVAGALARPPKTIRPAPCVQFSRGRRSCRWRERQTQGACMVLGAHGHRRGGCCGACRFLQKTECQRTGHGGRCAGVGGLAGGVAAPDKFFRPPGAGPRIPPRPSPLKRAPSGHEPPSSWPLISWQSAGRTGKLQTHPYCAFHLRDPLRWPLGRALPQPPGMLCALFFAPRPQPNPHAAPPLRCLAPLLK